MTITYHDIIHFWFNECESKQHFQKDAAFDELLTTRFKSILTQASAGELWTWRENALGRLAEIIILDQFSRNIYRDTAQSFAQDTIALILAQEAVSLRFDKELTNQQKSFLYMPFMHSESKIIHEAAIKLFSQEGLENNYRFELRHKEIIDRFGRYPHRNNILKRVSTKEEVEFLKQPGSSF